MSEIPMDPKAVGIEAPMPPTPPESPLKPDASSLVPPPEQQALDPIQITEAISKMQPKDTSQPETLQTEETKEEIKKRVDEAWGGEDPDSAINLVVAAYETDPKKVAVQLGKPEDDSSVTEEIKRREKALEENPKLTEALVIIEKVDACKAAAKVASTKEGYYDGPRGEYHIVEDGKPTKDIVRINDAVKPVIEELKNLAREKKAVAEGEEKKPTERAAAAQRVLDILEDRMKPHPQGGHYFDIEPAKPKPEAEQKDKLEVAIKEAQEFLSAEKGEFGSIILSEEKINPVVMTVMRVASNIDTSHEFARQLVTTSLDLLYRRYGVTRVTGERKTKLEEHLTKLHRLPGHEDEAEKLLQHLTQYIDLGDKYWQDTSKTLESLKQQGIGDEANFEVLTNVIQDTANNISRNPELGEQLKEAFENMVVKDRREDLFKPKQIISEVKKHPNYPKFKEGHGEKEANRLIESRVNESLLFETGEKGDWKGKAFGLAYVAFLILQLLEGTAKTEGMAGGEPRGGGGGH